jgi:hypothetical protein
MLITDSLLVSNNSELPKALARFCATNHIAHNIVSTPTFFALVKAIRSSTAPTPSRNAIGPVIKSLAVEMREQLWRLMKASTVPIAIATDGWTNVQQSKVTNIILIVDGVAFYWNSLVNKESQNSAVWLHDAIKPKLEELITNGVRFSGFIADNESVNKKLFRLLKESYPFLIQIPCAAHTIQLIAKQVMQSDRWKDVRDGMSSILDYFAGNRDARIKLFNVQSGEAKQYKIVKPNSTRWNSQLFAAERLKKISVFIDVCIKRSAAFWADLDKFIEFMLPFKHATDVVQSDSSTLFDVLQQWNRLSKHASTVEDTKLRVRVQRALKHRWSKQVNDSATVAAALLSLVIKIEDLKIPAERIDSARRFICSYGAEYMFFFKLSELSKDALEGRLMIQCAEFTSRTGRFQPMNEDIRKTKLNGNSWSAIHVWNHYTIELAVVACALLRMPASEAAVERSFSAQGAVHSKIRNRLGDQTVEDEMFVSFNHNALNKIPHPKPAPRASELEIEKDFMEPDEVGSDAETESELSDPDPDDESNSNSSDQGEEQEEEQPEPDVVQVMRSQSEVNQANREFLSTFIKENKITLKTKWTSDPTNALEAAAERKNPGGYSTPQLIQQIKYLLKHHADNMF